MELIDTIQIEVKWNPELRLGLCVKALAGNTNDRVPLLVERDCLANDLVISAEPSFPEPVAQHNNIRTLGTVFVFVERTPQQQ